MLTELPSDMNGLSKTSAVTRLFKVNYNADKMDKYKAQLFHHLVAELLNLN